MIAALLFSTAVCLLPADPDKLAREYISAVEKLNESQARPSGWLGKPLSAYFGFAVAPLQDVNPPARL